jgi:hypothetical protein
VAVTVLAAQERTSLSSPAPRSSSLLSSEGGPAGPLSSIVWAAAWGMLSISRAAAPLTDGGGLPRDSWRESKLSSLLLIAWLSGNAAGSGTPVGAAAPAAVVATDVVIDDSVLDAVVVAPAAAAVSEGPRPTSAPMSPSRSSTGMVSLMRSDVIGSAASLHAALLLALLCGDVSMAGPPMSASLHCRIEREEWCVRHT